MGSISIITGRIKTAPTGPACLCVLQMAAQPAYIGIKLATAGLYPFTGHAETADSFLASMAWHFPWVHGEVSQLSVLPISTFLVNVFG